MEELSKNLLLFVNQAQASGAQVFKSILHLSQKRSRMQTDNMISITLSEENRRISLQCSCNWCMMLASTAFHSLGWDLGIIKHDICFFLNLAHSCLTLLPFPLLRALNIYAYICSRQQPGRCHSQEKHRYLQRNRPDKQCPEKSYCSPSAQSGMLQSRRSELNS